MASSTLLHPDDYVSLVTRQCAKGKKLDPSAWTDEERKRILEFQRAHKCFSPELTMLHGAPLLQKPGNSDDVWILYEQVCLAALHVAQMPWAVHCIEKLKARFPESKRVKRIYGMYREAVGEWAEAKEIYTDLVRESPESTFSRKRLIAIARQQGKPQEACDAALTYLQSFGTDKEVWHELAQIYLEQGQLNCALFCLEDLVLQDARNLYVVLTYAETLFSLNQCFEHIEFARKYFCLALQIDDGNLRGLWGLFFCSLALYKRDQGAEKILQLQEMCVARLKSKYNKLKNVASSRIMLSLIDSEVEACHESLKRKAT